MSLTPGDRVRCPDGRTGVVKKIEYVYATVDLDATETEGRELRIEAVSNLDQEGR